jgi:hypothetical protein
MSKLRCHISISLDGFVAGPSQSEKNPLGEGGERLHDWVVQLASWRQAHEKEGGEVNESPSTDLDRGRSPCGGTYSRLIRGRKSRMCSCPLVWSDGGPTDPAQ